MTEKTKLAPRGYFFSRRSLWAYRSFPPEQPQREIPQKKRRTLQRRRASTSKKRKRTTIRTDKKGHHTRIQETGTEHFFINTNLKICNFLDVTLNLTDGTYYPYRKPNNETLYIDSNSNHPPTIIKHLPVAIGRRISDISSSKELFTEQSETTLRKYT